MKIVFLAIVAILVLGGGGAFAYFYFGNKAEAAVSATDEHEEAAPAKKEHGKKKEAKKGGHGEEAAAGHFVSMDPLILPIIDETGVTQSVSLVVVIEVGDEAKAATVEGMIPRLKDAYIQDMYGALNKHEALKNGVLQVNMIKERLSAASNDVLGEDVVDEVLLQVVQQRQM